MPAHDLAVVGGDVVLPGGASARVDIGVRDGRIAAIADGGIEAERTLDATGLVVLPGLIDEHFHVFRGYPWETYENATRAAVKGGVTSVVDMPLDKPPTLTAARLRDKLDAIAGSCHVDYACFGGYLAEDPDEMARMAEAGASALQALHRRRRAPRHVPGRRRRPAARRPAPRGGARAADDGPLREPGHGRLRDRPHAGRGPRRTSEPGTTRGPGSARRPRRRRSRSRPRSAGARVVIAHVSSPETVDAIDDARRRGADVWAETCHHYLCTTREACAGDLRQKWNPPTRNAASVDRLWEHVREGRIHTVGSDHAPLPKADGATTCGTCRRGPATAPS